MGKTEKQSTPLSYHDEDVLEYWSSEERDAVLFEVISSEGNPPQIKQIIYQEIEKNPNIYVRLKQDDCIGVTNLLIEIFLDIDLFQIRGEKVEEVKKELKNAYMKISKAVESEGYFVNAKKHTDGYPFNVIVYDKVDLLDGIIKPSICFRCSSAKIGKDK